MHANLHMNAICRSGGGRSAVGASAYRSGSAVTTRSVVAFAAYRSGERINDERQERVFDFTKKENVLHAEIIVPENAPEWMNDREKLWNKIEQVEKRKDAQLAKEIILTLPRNLTTEQHKEVVREFVTENLTSRGLVADYAIHSPEASDGDRNPHAHIMFTLRGVEGDGFGKKQTGYQGDGLDSKHRLHEFRQSYETILNQASEQADSETRFDLRNLKEKGIDREPQLKIGPKVKNLERKGYETEWGKETRQVKAQNHAKQAQQAHSSYGLTTTLAGNAVNAVRDDIAHKYYEVMYGPEAAYGDTNNQHDKDRDFYGYER